MLGLPKEALALGILQQHLAAGLADALQDLARVLEVADVEDRQVQLDVACMSRLSQQLLCCTMMSTAAAWNAP